MISPVNRIPLFILLVCAVSLFPRQSVAECIKGDCVNGHGTYEWSNGDRYSGEWKNGKRNGRGRYIWSDGDSYIGRWRNGKSYGQGIYNYPTGVKHYVVEIKKSIFNGTGCVKGDCIDGHGIYIWLSGAKYIGDFEDGERSGVGHYIFPNGRRISGNWEQGRFVSNRMPHS